MLAASGNDDIGSSPDSHAPARPTIAHFHNSQTDASDLFEPERAKERCVEFALWRV
jgi:hypothetical protein